MTESYDVIIIGAGVAGIKTATLLKELREQLTVKVITKDPFVYTKMALHYVIKSDSPIDLFKFSFESSKTGFDLSLNTTVTDLNLEKKIVKVESNGVIKKYSFNKLVLALGAKPIIPDIRGSGKIGVLTFNEYNDVLSLKRYIKPGNKVFIVGAGLVGLLLTEALRARGLNITLIDVLPGIGLTIVEDEISKYLINLLINKGVKVLTGVEIEKILGDRKFKNKVRKVIVNGDQYRADLVIFTTGVTPNTDLTRRTGIELGIKKAIRTNNRMETNYPDVYAIGDCATSLDYFTKKETYRPLGILAVSMAEIAGKNIVGIDTTYDGFIPMQYFEVFNTSIIKVGLNIEEARELGLNATKKLIKYKVPGIGSHPVSLLIHLRNRKEELIGWQVASPWLASYKSAIFIKAVKEKLGLNEFLELEKNIEIIEK